MSTDGKIDGDETVPDGAGGGGANTRPTITEADRRKARAAAKLKENLLRRKHQVRARRAGEADETDGLPAAKMDKL